jgi:hypothetical protein
MFGTKLQNAKCRVQNAKVKMKEKDAQDNGHTSLLQFEIYNLHFALAAAEGRAMF